MNIFSTYKQLTTSHCYLCEIALRLVLQFIDIEKLEIFKITNDEYLFNISENRIPILIRIDNLGEIDWPFNRKQLERFITLKDKKPARS